jgi:DNA-binding GntR family transcriptional regulator
MSAAHPGGRRLTRIRSVSAVDAVLTELRDAILTGAISPGEPLDVRALEEQLGVSHIPIREAFRQLEVEGLIVAPPRRKPEVAAVTMEEMAAVYELRKMVEIPFARRGAEVATAAERAQVRAAFDRLKAAPDIRAVAYWDAHRDLHRALIAGGATAWGLRVLEPLWQASERYVRLFVSRYGSPTAALRMHRELVAAFETGVPDVLAGALERHFEDTERIIRSGWAAAFSPKATEA